MIDALLYAVRDIIRASGLNYGRHECEITGVDGKPPPSCGGVYVAVHDHKTDGGADNNLDERFDFSLTLTMRVTIPLDKLGDQLIARNINLVPQAQRQGFNAKVEQLRGLLHMNWPMTVLVGQTPPSANDNLAAWTTGTVYGFVEPARWRGAEIPVLKGGDWLGADPEAMDFAIKSEMRFEGARRMQPQTAAIGPFV